METPSEQPIPETVSASAAPEQPSTDNEHGQGEDKASTGEPLPLAEDLGALISTLSNSVQNLDQTLKDSQEQLQAATKRKGQTQPGLDQLRKADASLTSAKADASAALRDAENAKEFAEAPINDQLKDEDQERLQTQFETVTGNYNDAEQALTEATAALTTHEDDAKAIDREIAARKASVDAASASLTTLAADIKDVIAPLKSLSKNLRVAAESGQAMKAFVLRTQLQSRIDDLKEQMGDEKTKTLVQAFDQAQRDLLDAYEQQVTHAGTLPGKKAAVEKAKSEFDEAKKNYPKELESLYVSQDQQPADAKA